MLSLTELRCYSTIYIFIFTFHIPSKRTILNIKVIERGYSVTQNAPYLLNHFDFYNLLFCNVQFIKIDTEMVKTENFLKCSMPYFKILELRNLEQYVFKNAT